MAEVDDLVLISEDNQPPLKWPLGRVEQLHSGADGLVRAATIKTATGTFKRAITRLAPLPINDIIYNPNVFQPGENVRANQTNLIFKKYFDLA